MKVQLNGNTIYLDFYKRHVCRPPDMEHTAWNEIVRLGKESLEESIERYRNYGYQTSYKTCCRLKQNDAVLSRGETVLNPNDHADRFIGKKIALKRALNNGTTFNKDERRVIWDRFMDIFGHLAK